MENKGTVLRWLHRDRPLPWGRDPAQFEPEKLWAVIEWLTGRVFGPRAYFPVQAKGMERIPPAPVMVVSNHSGGTSIPDVWAFAWLWYRTFGAQRPIHPVAHEMVFSLPPLARWFAERGVLRADPGLTMKILTEFRRDVMVMPGGDLDTWRPWHRRYEVEFAGRTGYARTALRARVPIVPVAHAGAHDTLMVLTDGREFAKLVGLRRLARMNAWPVHVSLPLGLTPMPSPHIPLPVTMRYRVGEPIPVPSSLGPGDEPDDAMVIEHDARVRAAVQALLYELRDELEFTR